MPGQTHIALLRGINVGGKNKLPMKDLAALFRDAGCDRVQTYIQSGNVVFQATPALASCIPALIAKAISESFGYRVPVVTRTADERSEEHTSELQSPDHLVCRLLLEKKKLDQM